MYRLDPTYLKDNINYYPVVNMVTTGDIISIIWKINQNYNIKYI